MTTNLSPTAHAHYAILLFVLLGAFYFLTYSGHSVSGDEEILFDGVHSMAQHGNLWLSYMNDTRPVGLYPNNAPVPSVDSELMQIVAAVPLFWLAQNLPGIGLIQTVWLLNLLVTPLTAVVLFYYGLNLGYSRRTSMLCALLFGLATTAWPYSKVFFREPLLTMFIFLSAYCLQRWRMAFAAGHFRFSWVLGTVITLAGALATKNSAAFFLPVLLIISIPGNWRSLKLTKTQAVFGAVGLIAVGIVILLISRVAAHGRYDIVTYINTIGKQSTQNLYALGSYLLSPGRSIWAFSPVLLLGLWGLYLLRQQKRWREMVMPLLALLGVAVGYAALQGLDWYGGLSWGPRYLLPAVPFVALLLLPVIDACACARRWVQIVVGVVVIFSVWVQILGTLLPLGTYYDFLIAENIRLGLSPDTINGWQAGTWDLHYIPLTVLPHFVFNSGTSTDLAWRINSAPGIALWYVLIISMAIFVLVRLRTDSKQAKPTFLDHWSPLALLMVFFVTLPIGLYIYRADPRYGGDNTTLHNTLDTLNAHINTGDAVLLNDRSLRPFFMNYYKSSAPIFTLPDSPGEVSVPGIPPEIVSTNLEASVQPIMSMMMPRIALLAHRWWFATEFIPADTRRTRVTEQYLTQHYFPVQELFTSDVLRLIEFNASSAPPDTIPPWPVLKRNDTFGGIFTLVGADPEQLTIQRGQSMPLSLLWRFDGWPSGKTPFDYSLNVSLIDARGAVVAGAQRSGTPLGTFGVTSKWQPGGYYRDNHALSIPDNLAPGTYHIWVIWYDWRDGSRLTINGSDHDELYTIQIQ